MKTFVLDNSVAMRWLFGYSDSPLATNVLGWMMAGGIAHVPGLWLYEAVAVITKAQRTGKVSLYDADGFFEDLLTMEVVVDNQGAGHVFSEVRRLAAEHRLSGYDAAYLELSIRKGLPLATLDEELRQAAVSTGVALVG